MATITDLIPLDTLDTKSLYITRALMDMQSCSSKDITGLTCVKITSGIGRGIECLHDEGGYAWVTDGKILVIRPIGYNYKGADLDLSFSGAAPAKQEWFEIPAEIGEHICTLRNSKKLIVTVKAGEYWPDIDSIVNDAVSRTKSYTTGVNASLLKAVQKGLGTDQVLLRLSDQSLDPIIIQPNDGDEESLILDITTGGVNSEFSLLMPMRVN